MKKFKPALVAIATAMIITSCQTEDTNDLKESNLSEKIINPEKAFPASIGKAQTMYYGTSKLNLEKINDVYVLDGDILFNSNQLTQAPGEVGEPSLEESSVRSVGRTGGRWLNNTVYYDIEPSLVNQGRVTRAIEHWEENTALRFVRRTNQSDYIYFKTGGGCSSFIGRLGGRQPINLAPSCSLGNTIHEIGHAVGLYHEQSRKDRDQYVTINTNNIIDGRKNNFQTYVEQGGDGDEYTSELDFGSIMMYGPRFFSKNGLPTIEKKDGSSYTVQRDGLSAGDIQGINQMYPAAGGKDRCVGVSLWKRGNYSIGSKVIYKNYLFERVSGGWNPLGKCGS